jgi:ABC-type cobalamin/Fe3+-siderophores transport system ATPase subunit
MISISNLNLSYGSRQVVSDFSASFEQAMITAILGANGAGKSTLIAAIAGDVSPESGQITINNLSIDSIKREELAKLRSVAQQSHTYWMAYRTTEILRLGNEDVAEGRFNYLVTKLGIDSYLEQSVTTLSGGQSQRIEIARSLMRETPIVLLDEPFASQDMTSIVAIVELLKEERAAGRTIVLVAHERAEELTWCDQIIELNAK